MVVRNLLEHSKYPLFQCQGDSPEIFFQDNGEGDRCGSIGHPHISILTIDMNRILTAQFSHELTVTTATCPNKTKQIKKYLTDHSEKKKQKQSISLKLSHILFYQGNANQNCWGIPPGIWMLSLHVWIAVIESVIIKTNDGEDLWKVKRALIHSHRNVSWFSHYGNQ